ncbi:MAG: cytochrome c [Chloroflexi bacterium]|nr:cytochrome c [Chloroflexota bacterium]
MQRTSRFTQGRTLLRLLALVAVMVIMSVACSGTAPADPSASLPAGDAQRGQTLFAESVGGAPPCSNCHSLDGSGTDGPTVAGYGAAAASRVSGMSAVAYTYDSIVHPSAHVVSGYGNLMYNQYGRRLSPQQIADLIAYLLTL